VHLKLENMQTTGSFKSRGVVVQMAKAPASVTSCERGLVTLSAGNYGKSFACACHQRGVKGTVVMPQTAPKSREQIIRSKGCDVIRRESSELFQKVKELEDIEGMVFLHPFDDLDLIAGYGSAGIEMAEDTEPDIVLVCCGGGGLVSGVSAGLRHKGCKDTKIYAVDFDAKIAKATKQLFERGLVVEPSGAAAFAALVSGKVPELKGTVVVVVTGGNASATELSEVFA
uniref:L-serine ammonia-lyase n=1 Tax=Ciona savignyi TaxID=51511 RepID=H2YVS6_CIOSA